MFWNGPIIFIVIFMVLFAVLFMPSLKPSSEATAAQKSIFIIRLEEYSNAALPGGWYLLYAVNGSINQAVFNSNQDALRYLEYLGQVGNIWQAEIGGGND